LAVGEFSKTPLPLAGLAVKEMTIIVVLARQPRS
jgi:hypothetical protein